MIPQQPDFLVRVSCMTYNHAPYIVDAMNGFTMQQTDFPFVCSIIDDSSTDDEQEVIRVYLEEHFDLNDNSIAYNEETEDYVLTFARHKTNLNCFFAVFFLKYNHYSINKSKQLYISRWSDTKYVAMCEGDDYWIDSKKLQIQVTFLEMHPEYVICSHDFIRYFQDSHSFDTHSSNYNRFNNTSQKYIEYTYDNFFNGWWTQPLTCTYRNGDFIDRIPKNKYKYYRDIIFFYYVLKEGRGVLLKDVMSVYRIHAGGVWSSQSRIEQKKMDIYNNYNIYIVENDKRALSKVKGLSVELIIKLMREKEYKLCFESVKESYKYLPLKDFLSVLFYSFKVYFIK